MVRHLPPGRKSPSIFFAGQVGGHAGHFGHQPQRRFLVGQIFLFRDELDDVARRAARHAMPQSLRRSHPQTWLGVVVERAQPDVIGSLLFEHDAVIFDHPHQVSGFLNRIEVGGSW